MERLIAWRGTPGKIRVDNGPEFIANVLETWADNLGIDLKHIEKGKPYQNGYVERFNRTYREEVLDAYSFSSLKEAQALSNAWMWIYNNERPHKSLGYKSPTRYLQDQLMEYPTFINDKQNDWKTLILSATN